MPNPRSTFCDCEGREAVLHLTVVPHGSWGDPAFQGKVWVHAPLTPDRVYKTSVEYFFPDMENRKQENYKLGKIKANYCMQDTTSEAGEGKYMQTFLASAKDQPNF